MTQGRLAMWIYAAVGALAGAAAANGAVGDRLTVDGTTFEVVTVMSTPAAPHGVAFLPNGARGFVACAGDSVILEFDGVSFDAIERHEAGQAPLDVMLSPDGASLIATQFQDESLVRVPLDGGDISAVADVGAGPSLFTAEAFDGARFLVCERADRVHEIDFTGAPLRSWTTGSRPYPADATDDGVLLFVPNRDDGTVTVIDTLNETTAATVEVGPAPSGGAVTRDDVDYVVACRDSNDVRFINTASLEVVHRLAEGVGPEPFAVAMTPGGRFALVSNAGGETVSVVDVEARKAVGAIDVGPQPVVIRMHPDGRHALVSCEGDDTVHVIRVTREETPAPGDEPTEVVVLGMLHDQHRRSDMYSFDVIKSLLRAIDPDAALTEIPPNRLEVALADWRDDGVVEEPRVSQLPEYEHAVFPAADALGFEIVPVSGWTEQIDAYRTAALARIARDQARRDQWMRYAEAMATMGREVAAIGAREDPRMIHTEAYDEAMRKGFEPYGRYFNDDLAEGGWKNINEKHFALIEEFLDSIRGEGKRVVITFGAGHKHWFKERLRERDDVRLLDPQDFLDQIEPGRN